MRLGAHESVAGGLSLALGRAKKDGCEAVQIFTKNANQWREPLPDAEQIAAFKNERTSALGPLLSHTSYLINLATDRPELLERSIDSLAKEVERCSLLGVDFCVLHPGAHLGAGEREGCDRAAMALDEVHRRTSGATTTILLENTAGQGTCVGCTFPQLRHIFERVRHPDRLGVCLDTQHAFASGHDLSTAEGYERTFDEFDHELGLTCLRAFHLNDSKKPLGSRVDRHDHVGEGLMGLEPFWRLVNDPRFATLPAVVEVEPRSKETPYKEDVSLLRSLVGKAKAPARRRAKATT